MGFSAEKSVRVYDDTSGEYVYIGPDADGLDLVELRSYDATGQIESKGAARITMPIEQALLVAEAILYLHSPKSR